VDERGRIEGTGREAEGMPAGLPAGTFTPPAAPGLADRLQRCRMSHSLPYHAPTKWISGLRPSTVRRASRGGRPCDRVAFRIEQFLEGVERAL